MRARLSATPLNTAILVISVVLSVGGCTSTDTSSTTRQLESTEVRETPLNAEAASDSGASAEPAAPLESPEIEQQMRTIAVTSWGATIEAPQEWEIEVITEGLLSTTTAKGANGWSLRVDEHLEWSGFVDQQAHAQDLADGLSAKYADYTSTGIRNVTIGGVDVVRWDFAHTNTDGVHVTKTDLLYQASASDPPVAVLLSWPSSQGEGASQIAESIIGSLRISP